ncbi:hypothetical protein VPH35_056345 [Triticum aestivum]|uniref:Uncharacterized protein n=1 Tax=Triticum aestivum TaxID=4565 RepID=A0A080YTT8_WHEAT|nr:unnamed protein product [Triticum aestivum]
MTPIYEASQSKERIVDAFPATVLSFFCGKASAVLNRQVVQCQIRAGVTSWNGQEIALSRLVIFNPLFSPEKIKMIIHWFVSLPNGPSLLVDMIMDYFKYDYEFAEPPLPEVRQVRQHRRPLPAAQQGGARDLLLREWHQSED